MLKFDKKERIKGKDLITSELLNKNKKNKMNPQDQKVSHSKSVIVENTERISEEKQSQNIR